MKSKNNLGKIIVGLGSHVCELWLLFNHFNQYERVKLLRGYSVYGQVVFSLSC